MHVVQFLSTALIEFGAAFVSIVVAIVFQFFFVVHWFLSAWSAIEASRSVKPFFEIERVIGL